MSKRQLYRDVLTEGVEPDFEEAIFRKTVRTAKRVRRTRTAVRGGLVMLMVLSAMLTLWPRRPAVLVKTTPEPTSVASHQTITTQPFGNVIQTEPGVTILSQSSIKVAIISTAEEIATPARLINDEELLALFEDKAVALLNRGSGAELIFLDEPTH